MCHISSACSPLGPFHVQMKDVKNEVVVIKH